MKSAICREFRLICFTDRGETLLRRVAKIVCGREETEIHEVSSLSEWTREAFHTGNALIFIGALGIAVRAVAPFVSDKMTDPAVLVMDEGGSYVIPVLSGHLGGAVALSRMLSERLGAEAVLTTATDTRGMFSVDVFAKDNDLVLSDRTKAKEYTAELLRTGGGAPVLVSPEKPKGDKLQLIPHCLVIGMGCRRGKDEEELYGFVKEQFEIHELDLRAAKALVSIDLKAEEQGLTALAKRLKVPFLTYDSRMLMSVEGDFQSSEFVKETTGADNICERAVRSFGAKTFLIPKTAKNGMTIAVGIMGENG